ncbi:MAG: bifunctional biotin--[acetyl-CoA-carboxylase] ligase/biotin operon repressor BirA [Candidatus Thiodiazotropha sp.]
MSDHFDLIRLMADGTFHSGNELGEKLGISRAGVWKKLKSIKQRYDLEFDAVKGRGYRLKAPIDLLDQQLISTHLENLGLLNKPEINLHATIGSTNAWLMQQGRTGVSSGSVCLAEQQSAGKGRHGRYWISPFGRNVYLSILFEFDLPPTQMAGLSLASALGVMRMLNQLDCQGAGVKWPNDVHWQGKKLAGLLLEVAGEAEGPSQVVIGIGLNTRLDDYGKGIDQPWIDLDSIPGVRPYTRNEIAASLIYHLNNIAQQYRDQGFAGFLDEWHRHDQLLGKPVVIRNAREEIHGEHIGVDATGGIRLRIDGETVVFHAGEVSLRSYNKATFQ